MFLQCWISPPPPGVFLPHARTPCPQWRTPPPSATARSSHGGMPPRNVSRPQKSHSPLHGKSFEKRRGGQEDRKGAKVRHRLARRTKEQVEQSDSARPCHAPQSLAKECVALYSAIRDACGSRPSTQSGIKPSIPISAMRCRAMTCRGGERKGWWCG